MSSHPQTDSFKASVMIIDRSQPGINSGFLTAAGLFATRCSDEWHHCEISLLSGKTDSALVSDEAHTHTMPGQNKLNPPDAAAREQSKIAMREKNDSHVGNAT